MNSSILFLALLFFGSNMETEPRKINGSKNPLSNTDWRADGTPFESAERELYTFTANDEIDGQMMWGNFISFQETTFSTHYSAPCGNDCFTSVSGDYEIVGSNLVRVTVNGINYSGFCQKESVTGFQFQADYKVTYSKEGREMVFAKVETGARKKDQK